MQFTYNKTIGGRAWTSISLKTPAHEKALTLWSNSTFGILLYWWFANKQQDGRGSIGKSALANLKLFDVMTLSGDGLAEVENVFEEFSKRELQTINCINLDRTRSDLDEAIVKRVLKLEQGLVKLHLVRVKIAIEPSIAGQKVEMASSLSRSIPSQPLIEITTGKSSQSTFMFWSIQKSAILGRPKSGSGTGEGVMARAFKGTTVPGFTNPRQQTVIRDTGLPGTDHGQRVYMLRCGSCGTEYGANGSDIHLRRCPSCQGGKPGLKTGSAKI